MSKVSQFQISFGGLLNIGVDSLTDSVCESYIDKTAYGSSNVALKRQKNKVNAFYKHKIHALSHLHLLVARFKRKCITRRMCFTV